MYELWRGFILTSESAPWSTPGQTKVTNSWHLLCTTKLHTEKTKYKAWEIVRCKLCPVQYGTAKLDWLFLDKIGYNAAIHFLLRNKKEPQ